MTLPLFTAALSAWRAANVELPYATPPADVHDAVVKLSIRVVEGGRTAATLGAERDGSGIVIDPSGLVLTIGYLILEAESILVMTRGGQVYPATVVGFDHGSGFGLVRAPGYQGRSLELGDSSALRELATVCVAAHPGAGGSSLATVVARRRFTGWWEYMIDNAIFTAPPRYEHSGAGLIDAAGRLVGIASLWVSDAMDIGAAFPGNMFVPIDLLKPMLGDLVSTGRRRGPARPWLGVYSEQHEGHVIISRVLPDSPASQAGLKRGDIILGVGGQSIGGQSEFYERLWASGEAGSDITLHVVQNKSVKHFIVRSADRLDYLRPWRI